MDLTLDGEVVWALPASRAEVLRRSWERAQDCGSSSLDVGDPVVVGEDQVIVPRGVDGVLVGSPSTGFDRVGLGRYQPAALRGISPAFLAVELTHATVAGIMVLLLATAYGLTVRREGTAGGLAIAITMLVACIGAVMLFIATLLLWGPFGTSTVGALSLFVLFGVFSSLIGSTARVPDEVLKFPLVAGIGTTVAAVVPFMLWTAFGLRRDVATAMAVVLVVMAAASGPILIARRVKAHADDEGQPTQPPDVTEPDVLGSLESPYRQGRGRR